MNQPSGPHSTQRRNKVMREPIKIEPAIWAYRSVRNKKHGIGKGSRLRAFKLALCMFSVANGTTRHWYARFAHWLAIYGTPKLPPVNLKS